MERPPSFLSRASLARELDIAESTVDEMVRRGVLPKPTRLSTGCVRWSWEKVASALASLDGGAPGSPPDDPYIVGAKNATKTTAAGHA